MTAEDMMSLPNCPKCDAEYTYEDGALLVCPMCAHEWTAAETDAAQTEEQDAAIRDAVGNELQDGDAVTVIKDLKVKGSSLVIKVGTKAKVFAYCQTQPMVTILIVNLTVMAQ